MRILLTILLLSSINFCFGQQDKENKFNSALKNVITAFSTQDSTQLSKYIHRDVGINILHRVGVVDTYENFRKISFSDPTYPSILFTMSKGIKTFPLKHGRLPRFDCDKWSKKGLFVDTTQTDHLLSEICKRRKRYVPDAIPLKLINSFVRLENNSRRIVLIDNNNKELVFYLTYIGNRWYLTILDAVSADCSV
jgi:hypothetical protein